jgi:predicted PurR-regulated permease PerM
LTSQEPLAPEVTPSQDPETTAPKGDLSDLARAFTGPLGIRSLALTGLFVLACFYTFYLAQAFLLPIILALLLTFLLGPLVRGLARLRIPEALGALLVIVVALATFGLAAYQLSDPVTDWVRKSPQLASELRAKLRAVREPVERATQQVEKLAEAPGGRPRTPRVEVKEDSWSEFLVDRTTTVLVNGFVILVLLYFLLASGDLFLRKLIKVLPRFQDKKRAVQIAREIELSISRFLFTQTLINAGLAAVATGAFWLIGVPNPLVWGVLTGVLNYIPYVGALVSAAVVTLVTLVTYDSFGPPLLAGAASLVINSIEGYLVTPWIMGRRLLLNPVVIFLGLTFWGWLWGVVGALIAVPILVMVKIFCDHIEPLAPIGEFLGN